MLESIKLSESFRVNRGMDSFFSMECFVKIEGEFVGSEVWL